MTYAACLTLAVTLCAVGMCGAGDKGLPGNYEHLKKLEPLIGTWAGEFVASQDHPTANIKNTVVLFCRILLKNFTRSKDAKHPLKALTTINPSLSPTRNLQRGTM